MSGIIIPMAEITGGRAARVRVEADETAGVVAEFGSRLGQIGEALETDRLERDMGRARIDITRRLGEKRLEFDSVGDPDAIDRGWQDTTAALRAEVLAGVDPRNADRAGMAFDELASSHALNLGARALDLRQGAYRVNLDTQAQAVLANAAGMDPQTRAAELDLLTDSAAAAVTNGVMTPEQANAWLIEQRDNSNRAAALRALETDPEALIAGMDRGDYGDLDPVYAEGLRGRAGSAIKAEAARQSAESARATAERQTLIGDRLAVIAGNAWDKRVNAWEDELMSDPEVRAHPKFAEAQAAIALRDTLPEFAALPPGRQAELIAAERKRPISERYEDKVLEAMETRHAADKAAWEKDPIAQAAALGLTPPPPLPDLAGDPGEVAAALAARRGYGLSLVQTGYVGKPAYFSAEERAQLAAATGVDQDPAARARLAASLVAGFGPEAPRALAEIGGDGVFAHMGGLASASRNPALAAEAFKGQQMIDQKLVELPDQAERRAWVDGAFGDLFADDAMTEGRVIAAADAIYAARARGSEPEEDAYRAALNAALGAGVNADGDATGGVQRVRRTETLLPLNVSAAQVETGLGVAAAMFETEGADALAPWRAASVTGGAPTYAGQPLSADVLGAVRLRAVGNDVYELYVERRGQRFDVTDQSSGKPYAMRLTAFLKAVGP